MKNQWHFKLSAVGYFKVHGRCFCQLLRSLGPSSFFLLNATRIGLNLDLKNLDNSSG